MRLHVTCLGEPTTISVDDLLFDYLGAWLVSENHKRHGDAKWQHAEAKKMVQKLVRSIEVKPNGGLSQYVQHCMIRLAMPGLLTEVLEKRGPRYRPPSIPKRGTPEAKKAAEAAFAALLNR